MSNRITVDAAQLRSALEVAVTEKSATIPVLLNVLLRPIAGCLHVISTDLDLTTITDVDAVVENDSPILLPQRKVFDILKGETGQLVITSKETVEKYTEREQGQYKDGKWTEGAEAEKERVKAEIVLEVGGISYEIPTTDPANFPVQPEILAPVLTIPGASLKNAIARTSFAISKEESRYTLNGALFNIINSELSVVATDGHRLAIQRTPVDAPACQTLVPSSSIAWLAKRVQKADVSVTLGEEHSFWHVPEIRTVFIARKLAGIFPNYSAVMPRRDHLKVAATFPSADELSKSLVKVTRMADERSHAVKWSVNGSCVLSAQSTETGKATATVPAYINHSGDVPEVAIVFRSDFVLDFLKVAGKNSVSLALKDSQTAALMEVPEIAGLSYVLMPMRF